MTATLIVEDGTGSNPAANSYNSLAAIKTYMDDRGIVYTTDPLLISAAIQAMDFLESQRYKGSLYLSTQPLQWPRYLSVPNCGQYGTGYGTGYTDFGYTAIVYDDSLNVAPEYPNNVKKAQCLMTAEILKGNIPNESLVRAPFIKQQTVGPITRVYSETVGVQPSRFPAFYALLRDYLMSTGNISVSR